MENQKKFDLIISGIGSSAGGIFNKVRIDGQGKINGDVECDDFSISGVGSVEGSVKTKMGKISGKGGIKGNLQSDEFRVDGCANIGGSIEVKEIRFEGVIDINGSIDAETVENKGVITIKKDCNSEIFTSRGAFKIGGLLNAGNIDISLYAPCKAREIGGEKIEINMGRSFSLRKLIKSIIPMLDIHVGLCSEVIEGDEVYLEYTKAKVVRGNNVIIGEGCEIELVEYKGLFEKSDKSVVIENKKLG
ncbi:cytoskeletal protein CcmA (bactofilin family) [Anaerosolibacter carboniphilus]|uniref:Cytoskeletal protein CcmA (Bactofilin family) n=1 Tax=Anaerosolibacter carboniphilus TaxID=1417629 RepID=A0A841KZ20_9FIRM|nr:polymer-forming cytoskeletal protein [Anaerosolibacter carboniphilus]MBB6215375.1 cytoskeletal protein CcmA (bactofilin family) [Anaerosolibacter carboniphilus]